MAVILLTIFMVCVVSLLCYGFWWYGQNKKKDPKVEAAIKLRKNKDNIVAAIYKGAKSRKDLIPGSESLKIALLESLNISPEHMRECLNELKKEKLVIESDDSVSLTTFGVQYFESFIKPKPKKK